MTIDTKFNTGDTVYFLWKGAIRSMEIKSITTPYNTYHVFKLTINYGFNVNHFNSTLTEKDLYLTKQEAATAWLKAQDLEIIMVIS